MWVALLVVSSPGASCSPMPVCNATTCATGCCDARGLCQPGTLEAMCGSSGGLCSSCSPGTSCSRGACTPGGGTGGGFTDGTGGGSTPSTSGGAGGGLSGPGAAATARLCADYAEAYAGYFLRCGLLIPNETSGRDQFEAACIAGAGSLTSGRSVVNQAGLAACLSYFRTRTCTKALPPINCAPRDLFSGTVPTGGACFESIDCRDDLFCDATQTCPGRCVRRIAIGQPAASTQQCVRGAHLANGVCRAVGRTGEGCVSTNESGECAWPNLCLDGICEDRDNSNTSCGGNVFCGFGRYCVNSRCVPASSLGGACGPDQLCQLGLRCSATNVCERLSAPGGPCEEPWDCEGNRSRAAFCNLQGRCEASRGLDGVCSASARGAQCAQGLYCTGTTTSPNGVCATRGALNTACMPGALEACRPDLYCAEVPNQTMGICETKKGEGASCRSPTECLDRCIANRCTRPSCAAR
jgi:hypothetical protein